MRILKLNKLLKYYTNGKIIVGNVCSQAHGVGVGPEIEKESDREGILHLAKELGKPA